MDLMRVTLVLIGIIFITMIACNRSFSIADRMRSLDRQVIVNRLYTDEYEFIFKNEGPWEIYRASTVKELFTKDPFLKFTGDSLKISKDIPKNQRLYFGFKKEEKDDTAHLIATERLVPLEGQINCRDLGGLPTEDGRFTSWGKIFRSGKLDALTPQDLTYLENLQIKSIIDFRNDIEVRKAPDKYPAGAKYYRAPIADKKGEEYRRLMRQIVLHRVRGVNAKQKFQEIMEAFVDTAAVDFKPVFDHLLKPNDAPLIFHCSGGKDRTGAMAAIVLLALGVDEKTVREEYLMSNYYRYELNKEKMKKGRRLFIGKETLESAFVVQEAYINAVFDVINKKYKGIDNYLLEKFEISPEERRYLIQHYTYSIHDFELPQAKGS